MPTLFPDRAASKLTEPRELQRVLTELSAMTPEAGLREAADWIEALPAPQELGVEAALRILASLSECVQPHLRRIVESFVAASLARNLGRHAQWRLARQYVGQLIERYEGLLGAVEDATPAEQVAEIVVRLARSAGVGQKLDAQHYTPSPAAHWAMLGRAWRIAEQRGVGNRPVRIRIGRPTETTFETEYLRCVALASAALDELDEAQIDQAARLIHYVLPTLKLNPHTSPAALFRADPLQGSAPTAIHKISEAPPEGGLYLTSSQAVATLVEMEKLLHEGVYPTIVGLETPDATHRFAPLLRHLIEHWSGNAPVRRHRRYPLTGKIRVIDGVEALAEQLSGTFSPRIVQWDQKDASLQGVGAEIPSQEAANLLVGTMIGLHSEDGDHWLAGVLRRISRHDDGMTRIGIELISWHPLSARADDGARQSMVLLLDPLHQGAKVRVALPLGALRGDAPLYLIAQNKTLKLVPAGLVERGLDYEIRLCLVGSGNPPDKAS